MEIICAKPAISCYDFMRNLFATFIIKKKRRIVIYSIVPTIYNFKQKHFDYNFAFEDIEFRRDISNIYSDDIGGTLSELRANGYLDYSHKWVTLLFDRDMAEEILNQIPKNVKNIITELSEEFN